MLHHSLNNSTRMNIQHLVWQYYCDLHDANQEKLERLRTDLEIILPEFGHLQAAAGVFHSSQPHINNGDDVLMEWDDIFDGLGSDLNDAHTAQSASPNTHAASTLAFSGTKALIEHQTLCLPLNKNVSPTHNDIEISLQINQAEVHLAQLRELITEKSFQYSNVIHDAPMKGIQTKARTTIKAINS